jgi:DNA-binding transcriptional regulator YhcF (GntR family)
MSPDEALAIRLRDQIVSSLHRGRLRAGDRLPGIRQITQESGIDHRAVTAAYRRLEAEGLVEIRGRSGVYVAEQERVGGNLLSETTRWLAGVLAEGWKRQIAVANLAQLIHRATQSKHLLCGFVESNVDHMHAFVDELDPGFGLTCVPVYLRAAADSDDTSETARVCAELRRVDMVLTTAFHRARLHRLMGGLEKPLLIVSTAPELGHTIETHLRRGPLTVICVDPEFGKRVRFVYSDQHPDQIRVVLAEDRWAVRQLAPAEPVLLTRAARRQLLDVVDDIAFKTVVPHSPTLSYTSAQEIAEIIVRLNINAAHTVSAINSVQA